MDIESSSCILCGREFRLAPRDFHIPPFVCDKCKAHAEEASSASSIKFQSYDEDAIALYDLGVNHNLMTSMMFADNFRFTIPPFDPESPANSFPDLPYLSPRMITHVSLEILSLGVAEFGEAVGLLCLSLAVSNGRSLSKSQERFYDKLMRKVLITESMTERLKGGGCGKCYELGERLRDARWGV